MTIVARFYPNGEFTHGVDTSHRRHRNPRPQTSPPPEVIPVGGSVCLHGGDVCGQVFLETADIQPGQELVNLHGDKYTYLCADMNKHIYAFESADGTFVSVTTLSDKLINYIRRGELSPLGLSSAGVLQKKLETRKKSTSMTKRMARRIRNIGKILQDKYGHSNLSFLTLTVPDLSSKELHKVAMNWGAMVHKFLEWLRHRVKKQDMALEYVYCTEIQPKRLEKRHEYALHLHLVFRGRYGKKANWAITPKQARKEWSRCIGFCIGHGNFCKSALEKLHIVRKSAAGYLSKYMSKGNCGLPKDVEGFSVTSPPINWGGYSRNLSRELDKAMFSLRSDGGAGNLARAFIKRIPELLGLGIIAFYREGFIELFNNGDSRDSRYLKVGVGRFALASPREWLPTLLCPLLNNC